VLPTPLLLPQNHPNIPQRVVAPVRPPSPRGQAQTVAAATDVSDDSEQSMPQNHRAANHTHTAWQNEYFVLTDNKNFPDVRMRVRDRWKGPADLGRSCGSKTLVPSHYGDDRAEPDQVILALTVLMVYRWQQND
jgi:hypothetical protein